MRDSSWLAELRVAGEGGLADPGVLAQLADVASERAPEVLRTQACLPLDVRPALGRRAGHAHDETKSPLSGTYAGLHRRLRGS